VFLYDHVSHSNSDDLYSLYTDSALLIHAFHSIIFSHLYGVAYQISIHYCYITLSNAVMSLYALIHPHHVDNFLSAFIYVILLSTNRKDDHYEAFAS
jgi:hypothetical protein